MRRFAKVKKLVVNVSSSIQSRKGRTPDMVLGYQEPKEDQGKEERYARIIMRNDR